MLFECDPLSFWLKGCRKLVLDVPRALIAMKNPEMRRGASRCRKHQVEDGWSEDWTPFRKKCAQVFSSTSFEVTLALLILFNLVLLVMETDAAAYHDSVPGWAHTLSFAMMFLFLAELAVRLYVFRGHFFSNPSNVFDAAIVLSDVIEGLLTAILGESDMLDVI